MLDRAAEHWLETQLTDVAEVKVGVVVESMHRLQLDIASVWLVHYLRRVNGTMRCVMSSTTYLESNDGLEVAERLRNDFPHVQERLLQE